MNRLNRSKPKARLIDAQISSVDREALLMTAFGPLDARLYA
ncbi:hypothetical protein [Sphingopyxis sp.]